jgi:hypothetical protein
MDEERYKVIFNGLSGEKPRDLVMENLLTLFKGDRGTVNTLMLGKPVVLKRSADKETSLRFKKALERAGGSVVIKKGSIEFMSIREASCLPVLDMPMWMSTSMTEESWAGFSADSISSHPKLQNVHEG